MICLFADLSLLSRGNRRYVFNSTSTHAKTRCAGLSPRRISARMSERVRFVIAIAKATPKAAVSARGVANHLLRASHRFRNLMRPTGEASGPVFGDFVAVLTLKPALHPPSRRRRAEPQGSGFLKAVQSVTGRFRDWKLVVSVPVSKRFFRAILPPCGPLQTPFRAAFMRVSSRSKRAEFRPNRGARRPPQGPPW